MYSSWKVSLFHKSMILILNDVQKLPHSAILLGAPPDPTRKWTGDKRVGEDVQRDAMEQI